MFGWMISASYKGDDNCSVTFDDPKVGRYARMRWFQKNTQEFVGNPTCVLLEFTVTTRTKHKDDAQQGIRLMMIILPQVHDNASKQ